MIQINHFYIPEKKKKKKKKKIKKKKIQFTEQSICGSNGKASPQLDTLALEKCKIERGATVPFRQLMRGTHSDWLKA